MVDDNLFSDFDLPKEKDKKKYDFDNDSIDLSSSGKIRDKSTEIKLLIRVFEARLSGYEWNSETDKYIYTGRVMCGRDVINKATGLLQPFSETVNLITSKDFKTFSKQKWEINSTFNETILVDIGCPAENQKVIMKMFKTTLQNIGDILVGSRKLIEHSFRSGGETSLDNDL